MSAVLRVGVLCLLLTANVAVAEPTGTLEVSQGEQTAPVSPASDAAPEPTAEGPDAPADPVDPLMAYRQAVDDAKLAAQGGDAAATLEAYDRAWVSAMASLRKGRFGKEEKQLPEGKFQVHSGVEQVFSVAEESIRAADKAEGADAALSRLARMDPKMLIQGQPSESEGLSEASQNLLLELQKTARIDGREEDAQKYVQRLLEAEEAEPKKEEKEPSFPWRSLGAVVAVVLIAFGASWSVWRSRREEEEPELDAEADSSP